VNPEPNNLFLIGFRCTGKSSAGRSLSEKLGWPFIDTDSLLVIKQKMSIKEIVGAYGWEGFREMEHTILTKVCTADEQVVATGGGVVLNENNVMLMQKSGRIIWLKATPETIKVRMLQDKDTQDFRPSLTLNGSIFEIEESLSAREPLYKTAMDFFVDTDDRDIRVITDIIMEKIRSKYPKAFKF
jgi:shikimate kinase